MASNRRGGTRPRSGGPRFDIGSALSALRMWTARQWVFAGAFTLGIGLLIGFATVLIPNSVFVRDIPPVWWNYPVWLLTSVSSGMLAATYARSSPRGGAAPLGEESQSAERNSRRSSRFGVIGAMLAWFAVGCPVCNKIALLALGYSGALTFFAPFQPVLALAALLLTGLALIWRLQGQVACPIPEDGVRTMAGVEQTDTQRI